MSRGWTPRRRRDPNPNPDLDPNPDPDPNIDPNTKPDLLHARFKSNFATLDAATGVVTSRRADRRFEDLGPVLCDHLDGAQYSFRASQILCGHALPTLAAPTGNSGRA